MFQRKDTISKQKNTLYFFFPFGVFFSSALSSATGNNTLFLLFFCLFVSLSFKDTIKAIIDNIDFLKNITFKKVFKCYIEFFYIIIVSFGYFYFSTVSKTSILSLVFLIFCSILLLLIRLIELCYVSNDTQSNFIKAMNRIEDIDADITPFWKYKIWFGPKEELDPRRKYRHLSSLNLFQSVFFLIFLGSIFADFIPEKLLLPIIIIYIVMQRSFRYLLDKILKTYVRTEGICVSINSVTSSKGRVTTYHYKIVDFEKKREITISGTEGYERLFQYGDRVTVTHGAISKVILNFGLCKKDNFNAIYTEVK